MRRRRAFCRSPASPTKYSIVRDRWGIPHIYAKNADDLFFAQGFVQAQDRLFQIDLWRRSTQGRLAEILGADYVDRDRLTRLMRYRGDMNAEWESYAPDTRRIATRFVDGINAEIATIGEQVPEEFAVAGYRPEPWQPEDLLSRAEGFVMTSNANDEVFRAQVTAAAGLERTTMLLPLDPPVSAPPPGGIHLFGRCCNGPAGARRDRRARTLRPGSGTVRRRVSRLAAARGARRQQQLGHLRRKVRDGQADARQRSAPQSRSSVPAATSST